MIEKTYDQLSVAYDSLLKRYCDLHALYDVTVNAAMKSAELMNNLIAAADEVKDQNEFLKLEYDKTHCPECNCNLLYEDHELGCNCFEQLKSTIDKDIKNTIGGSSNLATYLCETNERLKMFYQRYASSCEEANVYFMEWEKRRNGLSESEASERIDRLEQTD